MAQTPKLPLELLANSAGNQVNANTSFQILAQLVQAAVLDKDLATPPGSPADGAMYIVASSPTGAWAGKATQLAYWLTSAGVWQFIVPREGFIVHVDDENSYYKFDGSSWAINASGGTSTSQVRTVTGTSGTVGVSDNTKMIATTNGSSVTLTIAAESTAAWPDDAEVNFIQRGAGAVTITGDGFAISTHASDTNVLDGQGSVATVKRFGADDWQLFGRLGSV